MQTPTKPPEHDALPRVADVCADDADVLALSVARFVAAGYLTGDVACWDAAFDGAERLLGAAEGARFVACLVCVVRALRAEREGDWSFMPATCCRLTGHECALMGLIGRGRSGLWEAVEREAAALTGGAGAPRLVAAVREAAGVLDGAALRLGRGPGRRTPVLH